MHSGDELSLTTNNSNIKGGGVIAISQMGSLIINGGVFRSNSAKVGGVIYCNLRQS